MPATQQSFDTVIINNSVSLMSKCLDLFLSEYLVAAVTWLVEIKLSPKWLTKMKVCCRTCSRVATDSLIKIRHRRIRISKALTPMAVKITGVYVNNITGSYPAAVCMIYLFIYYWYIYFCFFLPFSSPYCQQCDLSLLSRTPTQQQPAAWCYSCLVEHFNFHRGWNHWKAIIVNPERWPWSHP